MSTYPEDAWTELGRALAEIRHVDPMVASALESALAAVTRSQRPDSAPVGVRKTVSGRELPVYEKPVALIVETRCPRKYAIVDLELGRVTVRRENETDQPPAMYLATQDDLADIRRIVAPATLVGSESGATDWAEMDASPTAPWL